MFRFKQFTVAQDKCAMKVNTDGVLLGAWAVTRLAGPTPTRFLDIGTGTGVIALMMAQNFSTAHIDAIDIDGSAYQQAKENLENSPWADRLAAIHTPLQDYMPAHAYDVVISNPPYFVDDFKTGNAQKDLAKHSTALTYADLIEGIKRLLSTAGRAFLVIPVFNVEVLEPLANAAGLYVTAMAEVTAVQGKNPYLALMQLQWERSANEKETITIQQPSGEFTAQYKEVTKDYYLKF
ncbi:MAG TPA: methyltransferase [Chitinophagales bacterium]|nr:methyltransferase [Chitinophagales bacterium]